jgi:hypothetical protein
MADMFFDPDDNDYDHTKERALPIYKDHVVPEEGDEDSDLPTGRYRIVIKNSTLFLLTIGYIHQWRSVVSNGLSFSITEERADIIGSRHCGQMMTSALFACRNICSPVWLQNMGMASRYKLGITASPTKSTFCSCNCSTSVFLSYLSAT